MSDLREKYGDEKVLCVKAKDVEDMLRPGLFVLTGSDSVHLNRLMSGGCSVQFRDRWQAETDPSWKQLIPCCIFVFSPPNPNPPYQTTKSMELFTYVRSKKGGEARLHDLMSVCVGGHINPPDGPITNIADCYSAGVQRELEEEIDLSQSAGLRQQIIGSIYDPSTAVGEVHLGIVHGFHCQDKQVFSKEDHLDNAKWLSLQECLDQREKFEPWGQIILDHLLLQCG